MPITHGNAWSIYFSDPEGNGIEIFTDSPWHIEQPQASMWDMEKNNDAILEQTRQDFESNPQYGPIEDYYNKRGAELKDK